MIGLNPDAIGELLDSRPRPGRGADDITVVASITRHQQCFAMLCYRRDQLWAYRLIMDFRQVDLNLLVAFDVLMSEQNVTAAARRLSVGQSAMSSTLSRLRALLDDPVLERRGRTMFPTPLAQSLVGPVREALTKFNSVLTEPPSFEPAQDHRSFTVMASDYASMAVLQPLLVALPTEAPHVELRIQPVSASFLDDLTADNVDLTIVPLAAADTITDSFEFQTLYTDPYVIAVDADNPLVSDGITLEQFSSLPYLASNDGNAPTIVETQLDRLGIPRRLDVTTGFGIAPFLLRDTPFVSVIPASLASTVAEGARLKLLTPPMPLEPITEVMVWAGRNHDDPSHRWLRERLADIASQRTWPGAAGTAR
ncbi:LysR family transcriptional regulator [Rhodococcus sp. BP-316]|uniref:LysR family transcriptional regulator n=1 Tax=Rhodococcus sp. BP-316 TaxID=2739445 RepID=UPI001C9B9845|nr:LysR family transcriptional regulator [Rhodococcus sp. BP-316]MBY6681487.1 LysR family transcriptional regulator [Rhodococcus sp. BP-316]